MTEVVSLPIGRVASQRQSLQATRERVLCGVHVHSYNSHVYSTQSDDSNHYMCTFSHCYILVKVPRRVHYVKYCGREANKVRGEAECLIRHRDHNISVMYERPRCFNWFIVSIRSAENVERDGVVVSPSLLRLEEADCALLGSSNTFDLGMAEWTNGAIPSADVDCCFAGENEFILPADFERWFAEDDSAVELTPAVHVFLAVLNAVGSECCRCSEPVACQPPREKSTAPTLRMPLSENTLLRTLLHSTPRTAHLFASTNCV